MLHFSLWHFECTRPVLGKLNEISLRRSWRQVWMVSCSCSLMNLGLSLGFFVELKYWSIWVCVFPLLEGNRCPGNEGPLCWEPGAVMGYLCQIWGTSLGYGCDQNHAPAYTWTSEYSFACREFSFLPNVCLSASSLSFIFHQLSLGV